MTSANYGLRVGLVGTHAAKASLKKYVIDALGLADHDVAIQMAAESNHSDVASSRVGDVVLHGDAVSLHAGKVRAHLEANEVPLTLVQTFELQSADKASGVAIWKVTETFNIIETDAIIDAMIYNLYDHNVIRTILPRGL